VIVQDTTAEKRKENELRQTQKMEAIGKLAGGVAHDFNNLLTVIGGNTELIDDALPPEDPLRDELGQVLKATRRAASLTAQLLAFSRKEARETQPVHVNEVITDMERMLVRLIGEDVTLEARLSTHLRPISIDPGELDQIIMNLVLNARDAMPLGGPIVIETRPASAEAVSGTAHLAGDGVLLSVRDGGVGMDEEVRKRIFEPFFTTKPVGEGTGLGLSTVYGMVHRADGCIEVESEIGVGTTFVVWFPYARRQIYQARQAPGAGAPTRGTEKILVVEDEELVRVFAHRALTDARYDVLMASDGQEALELVELLDSPVDMVLTDVVMPRMKGPELAEHLSTLSPLTPVLFMCGYIDNKAVEEQFKDRPDALLRKPFGRDELCERVRSTLDLRDAPSSVA
jgi:two-component system cell cycle sensor histidine kinase/response regulator CckA